MKPSTEVNQSYSNNLECIKVAIRIRPFLSSEKEEDNIIFIDSLDKKKIKLVDDGQCFEASFDKIFTMTSKQEDIFNFVKESVKDVKKGINSTIFTYGQTGSGKTYTMFGSDWTLNEQNEFYPQIKSKISYDHQNFIK